MLWFAAHFLQFVKMFNGKIQNQQLEQDAIVMRSRKPFKPTNDENNNQILVNQNHPTTQTNGATTTNGGRLAFGNGAINKQNPAINQQSAAVNQSLVTNQNPIISPATIQQHPATVQQQVASQQSATVHKQPLCMQTYKHMFRAYRRPGDEKDELMINQDVQHDHIVIACRNQFFALSLTADQADDSSFVEYLYTTLITIWDFCVRLDTVKEEAKFKQQPVGLYTTEHRRTWWQIRGNLIKKPQNLQSLTCIEKCLLVLCIDDLSGQSTSKTFIDEADQLARLLHGSQRFSSNRWFDKFLNAMIGRCF